MQPHCQYYNWLNSLLRRLHAGGFDLRLYISITQVDLSVSEVYGN